ncbi:hypothetical protein NYE48_05330 [Paenibacillus sp. FSL M7-1455]|uniref:Uncharacterized protein n=1 Tax=Paenibacillus cookii TaxID=157839 RepID=A0ABQ4LVI8_9BACL|nr:hypothetical protein [Paenibacillus cookii]GIO67153.1 hypothetical protein J21TS3_19740 [Paenibacillus cookii]HWO55135.1 hypothetical protein [Paenibacillus cookii]
MGWGEVREFRYEYNEEVKAIDEQIIKLISTRRSMTTGKRFSPPNEQLTEWAKAFEMDELEIRLILHHLQPQMAPHVPNEFGPLLNVVSIMKKTVVDSCEYILTHAMQHEQVSIVHVEINLLDEGKSGGVHLKPNLMLEVFSDRPFAVGRHGSYGGGSHSKLQFVVSPPLPETLEQIEFSLVPSAVFMEHPIEEIILDKQVDFE